MKPSAALVRALSACSVLLVLQGTAWAAWPHDAFTNLPVSTAVWEQKDPVSVSDGAGGAIIAWTDHRNNVDDDVFVQRVTAAGAVAWTANGVNLTPGQPNNQNVPRICADGAGGVIVTWIDARTFGSTQNDIYVQRINSAGSIVWPAGGVALCTDVFEQEYPDIVADGAGGAIVAWADHRSGTYDIYARRINAAGSPQGAANGLAVCVQPGDQFSAKVTTDGAGGAIVTWDDLRLISNRDIYVHRVLANGTLDPAWTTNGVQLCAVAGDQSGPVPVPDGAGGAIVVWTDGRVGGTSDIYAGHVMASGALDGAWNTNTGVAICTATNLQAFPAIAADGTGGAFVTWTDLRNASAAVAYAQHVLPSGLVDPAWTAVNGNANGTAMAGASSGYSVIIADGLGGAIVAFEDGRTGSTTDVYANRVQASGLVDPDWGGSGRALCSAGGEQTTVSLVADGAGGALVAWKDSRTGGYDLYAQRIARFGVLGSPEPSIAGVRDVANDQGGKVNVAWNASWLDTDPTQGVAYYWILRALTRTPAPALAARAVPLSAMSVMSQAREPHGAILTTVEHSNTYYWEFLESVTALHIVQGYGALALTAGDSTGATNPRTYFMVVAWNAYGTRYWSSAPDSGYSVDNLPPVPPGPFTGQYVAGSSLLHWNPNGEADLANYRLYRGSTAGFTPGPGNLVASPADTGYVDVAGVPYYYKLSAVDVHGNESGYAALLPANTLDAPGPAGPRELTLAPPSPNPADGPMTFRFALPRPARASLAIFDAGGRQVRALAGGDQSPGEHAATWDARDGHGRLVAGGLYFARLQSEGREVVRRVTLRR